jgi:hypothetical protein
MKKNTYFKGVGALVKQQFWVKQNYLSAAVLSIIQPIIVFMVCSRSLYVIRR